MPEIIKNDTRGKIAIIFSFFLTVWWFFSPTLLNAGQNRFLGDFPSIYALVALLGAIWGFTISRKWGGFRSVMGKAIIFLSLGLFAQVFGQVIYAYYSFYKLIAVPYPSLGDLGYFGSIPLYAYGVLLLGQASGVKFSLKSFKSKIQAVLIPVILLIFSYLIFLQGYEFDWSSPITVFLDFGYPLGAAIYLSFALLSFQLSRNILGGVMKYRILYILLAFFIQYLSDFAFLYQAYNETYVAGGVVDYMYLLSYLAMTLGLLNLDTQSVRNNLDAQS